MPQRKKNLLLRPSRGYTAIELVVAMAILGSLIAVSTGIYQILGRMWAQMNEKTRLHRVLQYSMEQIAADLRQARNVTRLGPVSIPNGTTIFLRGQAYGTPTPGATPSCSIVGPRIIAAMPVSTIHLDSVNQAFEFSVPNLADPLNSMNDTKIIYYLGQEIRSLSGGPITLQKLYKQMTYYNGYQPPPMPVLVHTDRFRQEGTRFNPYPTFPAVLTPVPTWSFGAGTPVPEPPARIPTPNAVPTNTPNAVTSWTVPAAPAAGSKTKSWGRMAGIYEEKDLSFDDVAIFWDPFNRLISVGLTVSVNSASLTKQAGRPQDRRRKATLTTNVTFRRTEGVAICP